MDNLQEQAAINAPEVVDLTDPAPAAAASNSRKRAPPTLDGEEDAEADLDDDDDTLTFEWDCDKVRRMIRNFLDSGEMKVTHFQRTIGTNSNSYGKFMSYKGAWRGVDNSAMAGAYRFFRKREAQGTTIPKKRKTAAAPESDGLAAIHLDGEETDSVEVYDSCDEIRRKLAAHMRMPGVIQARLLKDLAAQFHAQGQPVKLQAKQLTDFRDKRGANAGNTSRVYYGAYVFFEKLRIKEGKPKSKHRLEMERLWAADGGVDTKRAAHNQRYVCSVDSVVYTDEYGCVRSFRP